MNLKLITNQIKTSEGMSYSIKTGILNPKVGYFASFESFELKMHDSILNNGPMLEQTIRNYILDNLKHLNVVGSFLGAWREGSYIVLDVSKQFLEMHDCIAFAKLNNQRAIYDAKEEKVIHLN